jgi:hypothetical protein
MVANTHTVVNPTKEEKEKKNTNQQQFKNKFENRKETLTGNDDPSSQYTFHRSSNDVLDAV